jgi:hypothetical protein
MNLKSKLAYMALGGILVLAGHVLPGLVVGSATAQSGLQDAEFNEVTVRKLTVKAEGFGSTIIDDGGIRVNGESGFTMVHSDTVRVLSVLSGRTAYLSAKEDRARVGVTVSMQDGKALASTAFLHSDSDQNGLYVSDNAGDTRARMGWSRSSDSGDLALYRSGSNVGLLATTSPSQGSLVMLVEDNAPRVVLTAGDGNGSVETKTDTGTTGYLGSQ